MDVDDTATVLVWGDKLVVFVGVDVKEEETEILLVGEGDTWLFVGVPVNEDVKREIVDDIN